MKAAFVVVLCAIGTLSMFSCKKKNTVLTCTTGKGYVKFYPADSAVLITDTLYSLTLYNKGSNFTSVAKQYTNKPLLNISPYNTRHAMFDSYIEYPYQDYDLELTTYPTGKAYRITGITILQRQEENYAYQTCENAVQYMVNDTTYTSEGTAYYITGRNVMYVRH